MIINFSVENFGSIKDEVTLSFEATKSKDLEDYYVIEPKKGIRLLKIGLIFGPNASGKTTVLKSLDFLRSIALHPLEKKDESLEFKPFLFSEETINANSIFKLEFIKNQVKYLYEVELNEEAIINEKLFFFKPNKATVFKRTTDIKKKLAHIEFGKKTKINKNQKTTLEGNTLWNNTVLGGFLKTNIESNELQEVVDWFNINLNSLIYPKTKLLGYISKRLEDNEINKKNIVEFLKKADFKISNILIKENETEIDKEIAAYLFKDMKDEDYIQEIMQTGKISGKEIYFEHIIEGNKTFFLPYGHESNGTQRYYQFSGLLDLMINKEVIFSIDELESSLHPDLLEHFLLTFLANSKKSQLIATTHQRELLITDVTHLL